MKRDGEYARELCKRDGVYARGKRDGVYAREAYARDISRGRRQHWSKSLGRASSGGQLAFASRRCAFVLRSFLLQLRVIKRVISQDVHGIMLTEVPRQHKTP